jgi:hypothetical protein
VVRASGKDAHWAPPLGGVSGTSSGEETSGKTQVYVESLYLNTGLGTPREPPSELVNVAREREVWGPMLELLPPQPNPG